MSSKDSVKFRYRIVVNNDTEYPYRVERKAWLFWKGVTREKSMGSAKDTIFRSARQEVMRPGKVIFEYNDADHLVEKLKSSE